MLATTQKGIHEQLTVATEVHAWNGDIMAIAVPSARVVTGT